MKNTVFTAIRQLAQSDDLTVRQRRAILVALGEMPERRELITSKAACQILGVSLPTLRKWVKLGYLKPIRFSARKIRFCKNEVLALANFGIEHTTSECVNTQTRYFDC